MFLSRYISCNVNANRFKSISVNETSIALRPFLFAVHPDLFGKYPKEQAVNETSLKLLNEHINKLHNKQSVDHLHLTFHIRNLPINKNSKFIGEFKVIKFSLDSQDVGEVVKKVLSSCDMSLDYLNGVNLAYSAASNPGKSFTNSADLWKTFSGYENEYFFRKSNITPKRNTPVPRSETENSINVWINNNRENVLTQLKLATPILNEILCMKAELINRYYLKDIVWQNSWTLSSFRTSLKGLINILNNIPSESMNLKDHTITFSNDIGISVNGHIVLQRDIVSNSWTNMFQSLSEKLLILSDLPTQEKILSKLLGGFDIVRPSRSVILAEMYLLRLKKLIDDILVFKNKEEKLARIDQDTSGVQLSVECTTGSLMLSQTGTIIIPSHCPTFLIFDFIRKNLDRARMLQFNYATLRLTELNLQERVKNQLKLVRLEQDVAVTQTEMLTCCRQLLQLREEGKLTADLEGISLRVAQHYAVTVDGEMCVPWNFKL